MLNFTNSYTVKKGCENRIFGFPQKLARSGAIVMFCQNVRSYKFSQIVRTKWPILT